ncbi:MAG: peptidylprolyl isomerase [Desulfobacterales bacterium]|nr:peptidylprolyl isomerase [Desulfobacterales bacterium]
MSKTISRTLIVLFAFMFIVFFTMPAIGQQPPSAKAPENVAMVNGAPITKKAYDQECQMIMTQMTQRGQKIEDNQLESFKGKVLDQIIGTELLYQESKEKGINISEEKLTQHLADIKKKFPSEAEFNKGIADMGMTETEMKVKIKKSMALQELITQYISKDLVTTDDEAKKFYNERAELFQSPETVKASHILIKSAPDAAQPEKDAALKKIKEIQKKVKKGEDFAELAKKNSECPSAQNGGNLDFFGKGQMVKPFEDTAFALAPGQVSDIVETQFGYHLIKVTEKKKAEKVPFETAKERIKEHLTTNKTREKVDQHINMLMGKAKIEKFM